jgi:nicotinate-nucleotide adenylyltransferase
VFRETMKLGIFGGTFNPIHTGHLLLAETARETLALDRVLFVPANLPPHKRSADLLDGAVRFKLVQLAIRDHPAFAASDIELRRPGPSYSIETVRALRRRFPSARLFLIIGQDLLTFRWVGWEDLKRLCTVVVARRPESRAGHGQSGLRWLTMPLLDIASSDIRARIRGGRSIRYLVPAPVERHIKAHRLYRAATRVRS